MGRRPNLFRFPVPLCPYWPRISPCPGSLPRDVGFEPPVLVSHTQEGFAKCTTEQGVGEGRLGDMPYSS